MNIVIFYLRLFQNTHQNASIINVYKKFLHENYPIANVYLKYYFFYIKNCNFKNFQIRKKNCLAPPLPNLGYAPGVRLLSRCIHIIYLYCFGKNLKSIEDL